MSEGKGGVIMNKLLKRMWCFIVGHDMIAEGEKDNGRYMFGAYRCMRCNYNHDWQYDYDC